MSKEVYPGGSFGATRAGTADSNTVQHPPAQGDDMQPGEALYADQSIWSTNGRFRLIINLMGTWYYTVLVDHVGPQEPQEGYQESALCRRMEIWLCLAQVECISGIAILTTIPVAEC